MEKDNLFGGMTGDVVATGGYSPNKRALSHASILFGRVSRDGAIPSFFLPFFA